MLMVRGGLKEMALFGYDENDTHAMPFLEILLTPILVLEV